MKNQLTALSKSIKKTYLTGGILFSSILIHTVYAACPADTITGVYVTSNNTCFANLAIYTTTSMSSGRQYTFEAREANAILNITNPNVIINSSVADSNSTINSTNGGLINIEGNITVNAQGTGPLNSAIRASNGSKINLLGDLTKIIHQGNSQNGGGLVVEKLNSNYGLSFITALGLVEISTNGAPGILSTDGGITVQNIRISIGNNGHLSNNGIYTTGSNNFVKYTSGEITSSGKGIRVEDGASVTSTGETKITTSNENAHALYTTGNDSQIKLDGKLVAITIGENTSGLYAENNGNIQVQGLTELNINGDNSNGIFADTNSKVEVANTSMNILGKNSSAIKLKDTATFNSGAITASVLTEDSAVLSLDHYTSATPLSIQNSTFEAFKGIGVTASNTTNSQININDSEITAHTLVNVADDSVLKIITNKTTLSGIAVKNATATSNIDLINNSIWKVTGDSQLTNLNNTNSQIIIHKKPDNDFTQLKIDQDYSGIGQSLISVNTKLASDNINKGDTDFITINGKATGSTELKVVNAGGAGAVTTNGIHVIQTGSSESKNTFYLAGGYTSVGAFEYSLNLKKAQTDTNTSLFDNWYLESILVDPVDPVDPVTPPKPSTPVYTPDVGEYLAAETMGNTLFTSRLEDREGASQYQGLSNKDIGNVWVRAYGGHNQFKTMESQLKTTGNSVVTQMGAALVTLGEEDQYNLGALGGFAYYDGKTRSDLTRRESKTKMNGYSLGLYGTWYAHPVERRGAYIDSWVLWNKFNNTIDTPDQNRYKFNSSGMTASIEVGGDYLINQQGNKNWWIQPQAQLIYQGVHADDFQDAQGVDIYHGQDNVQTRMGIKTYFDIPTKGNTFTSYRPYIALNYIQNTNPYSVVINNIRYENEGSKKQGEFKLGIEGNMTKNSQVWLNASYATGSHNNETYQGNIGWKYNF